MKKTKKERSQLQPGTAVKVIHKIAGLLKGTIMGPKNADGDYTVDIDGMWRTINERFLSED